MNARLEELKAIGFKKLKGDERKEYKQLLLEAGNKEESANLVEDVMVVPGEGYAKPVSQTAAALLSISEDQLEQIVERAIAARLGGRSDMPSLNVGMWTPKKPSKPKDLTATLKRYRDDSDSPEGLIIDWKFFKNEYDENTRKYDKPMYKLTIWYPKGQNPSTSKKEVIMPLEQFAAITNRITVKILKQDKEEFELVQGFVRMKEKTKDGYPVVGLNKEIGFVGDAIPAVVTMHRFTAHIELPREYDSEKLIIPSDRLNA